MTAGVFRQFPDGTTLLLGFQPGGIKELDKNKGQDDQQKDNARHQHQGGKEPAEIGMKGDVAETEGRHDRHGPIKTGDPAEFSALIQHQNMKKQRIKQDQHAEEAEKLPQGGVTRLAVLAVEKAEQMGGQRFHGCSFGGHRRLLRPFILPCDHRRNRSFSRTRADRVIIPTSLPWSSTGARRKLTRWRRRAI